MLSPFSLRQLAASRLLRTLALLGWLFMALSAPWASAMANENLIASGGMNSMQTGHAMPMHAMHGQHADHCCGGDAQSACHCQAMCGSVVLFSALPTLHGPARPAELRVSMRTVDTPAPTPTPPWRPPAV